MYSMTSGPWTSYQCRRNTSGDRPSRRWKKKMSFTASAPMSTSRRTCSTVFTASTPSAAMKVAESARAA